MSAKEKRLHVVCESGGCNGWADGTAKTLLEHGWACLEDEWRCPNCMNEMCSDAAPSPPIAPAQWSTEPPREPGQRWAKHLRTDEAEIVDVYESADGELTVVRLGDSCAFGLHEFALWWPVRIEPPR